MGGSPQICEVGGSSNGILLPALGDMEAEWPDWLQSVLYLFGLLWCFMGVAIICDVFMGAIEKITSQKVQRVDPATGKTVTMKVWNDTVANLTLMALGSSAPEILLNVKEIFANKFYAGDLGPSTIVGSAAFNLLVIIAVCTSALPDGETRRINDLGVYSITACSSIFAYLWLLFILKGPTPNRVDFLEGIFTFLFFPAMVYLAYLADVGRLPGQCKPPKANMVYADASEEEISRVASQVKLKFGDHLTDEQIAALIEFECKQGAPPHSRAFHRVAATRALCRGKKVVDQSWNTGRRLSLQSNSSAAVVAPLRLNHVVRLKETEYVVLESAGSVRVKVLREGPDVSEPITVSYKTMDGSAQEGSDYIKAEGTLEFAAGDKEPKCFDVEIIKGDDHEATEAFYVQIDIEGISDAVIEPTMQKATIWIVDENHPGKLRFAESPPERHIQRSSADTELEIKVLRKRGCDGDVTCALCAEGDSALPGTDFEELEETLTFKDRETEASFKIKIPGKTSHDGKEIFYIILKDATGGAVFDPTTDGGEESCIFTVHLEDTMPNKVFNILKMNNDKLQLARGAWKDQFVTALCCNGDREGELDATASDWIIHFVALPWKLFFALVPPVHFCGGWLCFCVALAMIGIVTILIGDLAAMLGCAVGISQFSTAITLVALGTSLPDTFASKTAALQDTHADASIGNVTGSNSVNVFLGLGLPWMIGAFYWAAQTPEPGGTWYTRYPLEAVDYPHGGFIVQSDGLGPSVLVFCLCSITCIGTLALRRRMLGYELGGEKKLCYATSAFFMGLWVVYIVVSILNDEPP